MTNPLAQMLASKAGVADLAGDYIFVSMLGAPFIGIGLLMVSYLGTEGILLSIEEEEMRLRIRDSGIPFNPAEYTFDSDGYEFHGIELVKRISSKVDYIRTMDMDNTVIAFARVSIPPVPRENPKEL